MQQASRLDIQILKIVLTASVAGYAGLVAFNNITDYWSNYHFVAHVLAMDTTFENNSAMWRSITSPVIIQIAYLLIILAETAVAFLCALGAWRMFRGRNQAMGLSAGIAMANYGLGLGVVLWFIGFIVIGGEWFLMWQSATWNGIQSSFQIAAYIMLVMIFINCVSDRHSPDHSS